MVLGAGLEAGMNYGLHDLPERLQEDNPRVSVFPLGIGTSMVQPNYCGIFLVLRMYWTISMSCIYLPGLEFFLLPILDRPCGTTY